MFVIEPKDYRDWRDKARRLLQADVPPEAVLFRERSKQPGLFKQSDEELPEIFDRSKTFHISKAFLSLADKVSVHRDESKWEVLYRVLWRLTHENANLLEVTTDNDVYRLTTFEKQVRRDAHKAKAFVRFRKVLDGKQEHFIAWHRPDHRILRIVAPFFSRRFPEMHWSILTPDESVVWNLEELHFGPGVRVSEAPQADELEDLWKSYYRSTFNPARVKLKMMKSEMPVRYWSTLPETEIIADLLEEAPQRVAKMIEHQEGVSTSAADFYPDKLDHTSLSEAAKRCQGCHLHEPATQTVFGEGPTDARIVFVGEQPGHAEDLAGKPFIGPAGTILDEACREVGLDRNDIYVTNTVKHFKFQQRGKRRLHQKPSSREVTACRPWLEAELTLIQPEILVCLGATAAQTVIGREFRLSDHRGEFAKTDWCDLTIATYHPSAVLRMPNEERKTSIRSALIADLSKARHALDNRTSECDFAPES